MTNQTRPNAQNPGENLFTLNHGNLCFEADLSLIGQIPDVLRLFERGIKQKEVAQADKAGLTRYIEVCHQISSEITDIVKHLTNSISSRNLDEVGEAGKDSITWLLTGLCEMQSGLQEAQEESLERLLNGRYLQAEGGADEK